MLISSVPVVFVHLLVQLYAAQEVGIILLSYLQVYIHGNYISNIFVEVKFFNENSGSCTFPRNLLPNYATILNLHCWPRSRDAASSLVLLSLCVELCKKRLNSLYSRLVANKALLSEYNKIFQDQLAQGIVEKVPLSEISKDNVNFMPHHAVIREERTTSKVRVVFDASCKSQSDELSLNDRLERGPNCIPLLFDVMVRFRVHTVALIADIEKAFLQIEIRPEDRDYLRFLWLDDVSVDKPAVIQLRYTRLPFGLRPSPSVLGSVIKAHLTSYEQSNPEVVKVLRQIFVDDLSTGANSVEHAFDIYQKSKEIMSAGSFNLRKWNSNSKELLRKIAREERQIGGLEIRQSEATLTEDGQTYAKASIGLSSAEDQS